MSNTRIRTVAAAFLVLTSTISAVSAMGNKTGVKTGVINKLTSIQNTIKPPAMEIEPPQDTFTITHSVVDTSEYSKTFLKSLSRLPNDFFLKRRVENATPAEGQKVNAREFLNGLLKPIEITFYPTQDNQALNILLEGYFVKLEEDYNKHLNKIRPQVTLDYFGNGKNVKDQVQNIVNQIQGFVAETIPVVDMIRAISGNQLPHILGSLSEDGKFDISVAYYKK